MTVKCTLCGGMTLPCGCLPVFNQPVVSTNWKDDQLMRQQQEIMELKQAQDNLIHDNSELLNSLNLTVEDNLKLEQERGDYQDKYSRLKMMHNKVLTDQLKRLQYRLQERFEWVLGTITQDLQAEYEKSLEIIEQSPKQSLAEVQAKAIEDAVFDADTVTITSARICSLSEYVSYLKDYASKIRAQAKEGVK